MPHGIVTAFFHIAGHRFTFAIVMFVSAIAVFVYLAWKDRRDNTVGFDDQ